MPTNCITTTGEGLQLTGMAGLMLMSVTGTIIIDILICCAAMGGDGDDNNNRNQNNNDNAFLTGYLLGSMGSNNNNRTEIDPRALLIASPIITGIAVGLAFWKHHPNLAMGLVYAFSACAGLTLVGTGIKKLGETLDECQSNAESQPRRVNIIEEVPQLNIQFSTIAIQPTFFAAAPTGSNQNRLAMVPVDTTYCAKV